MSASARPDYIELPATDVAATKAFYTEAFGWTWQDFGPTYAAVEAAEGAIEVALNGEASPVAPHEPDAQNAVGPLVLFSSPDLEVLVTVIEAAGGTILSAIYAYPGGRRFHFVDPSGNVLGAYQPG